MAIPLYVGIDPGFTGYITVLDDKGNYLHHFKTPTIVETKETKRNKTKLSKSGKVRWEAGAITTKTNTSLDEPAIYEFLRKLTGGEFDVPHSFIPGRTCKPVIVVEKQHAVTGQGLASTAKTMYGYGFWMGMARGLGYEVHAVSATEWQKVTSDPKALDKKAASVASAKAWNKEIDLKKTKRSKVEDHNLADSVNIARYCWHKFGNNGAA